MTSEHLVDSTKLYDYYVNRFKDIHSPHTARVHLSKATPSSSSSTPIVYSAPSLMDLLNVDNIEPQVADAVAMEEFWFNNPDPYDLDETDRTDPVLQETVTWSYTWFDIANYVKLDDCKLIALISSAEPGAMMMEAGPIQSKLVGKPGEWSVASFLGPLW